MSKRKKSQIHYVDKQKTIRRSRNDKFNYQMLSRMKGDVDYYLGHGNRHTGHLLMEDEKAHIEEMRLVRKRLPRNQKPEWLTGKDLDEYEKQLLNPNYNVKQNKKNWGKINNINKYRSKSK